MKQSNRLSFNPSIARRSDQRGAPTKAKAKQPTRYKTRKRVSR